MGGPNRKVHYSVQGLGFVKSAPPGPSVPAVMCVGERVAPAAPRQRVPPPPSRLSGGAHHKVYFSGRPTLYVYRYNPPYTCTDISTLYIYRPTLYIYRYISVIQIQTHLYRPTLYIYRYIYSPAYPGA